MALGVVCRNYFISYDSKFLLCSGGMDSWIWCTINNRRIGSRQTTIIPKLYGFHDTNNAPIALDFGVLTLQLSHYATRAEKWHRAYVKHYDAIAICYPHSFLYQFADDAQSLWRIELFVCCRFFRNHSFRISQCYGTSIFLFEFGSKYSHHQLLI